MDEAKLQEIEARIPSAATQCMWCDRLATLRCKGCGGLLCDEHRDYLRDGSPCAGDATEPVTHDHVTADRIDLVAEVRRLTAALATARREGAEEMREVVKAEIHAAFHYNDPPDDGVERPIGPIPGQWEAHQTLRKLMSRVCVVLTEGGAS